MMTLRFWLPAHASARLSAMVLFPAPSLGPLKTTTRQGSRALPVSVSGF
ncbi:MAG: hypothetical protein HY748_12640 [Elusimicrobia bacterium]|nr:hypothetical protein [Elusimicrobiota bacterium]